MRTYMILKEKVARWNADSEIQAIRKVINVDDSNLAKLTKKFSAAVRRSCWLPTWIESSSPRAPLPYEKLDQLTMEDVDGRVLSSLFGIPLPLPWTRWKGKRVAWRGRLGLGGSWFAYVIVAVGVLVVIGLIW